MFRRRRSYGRRRRRGRSSYGRRRRTGARRLRVGFRM